MKNSKVKNITHSAIIAALYVVLTLAAQLLGLASGAIQVRFSEALTILPVFTSAAIPGLTVGCIIANLSSVVAGLGIYDMLFGSFASLVAALSMYALRNIKFKNIPLLGLLMPATANGIIVGFEIAVFFVKTDAILITFLISTGCFAASFSSSLRCISSIDTAFSSTRATTFTTTFMP